MDILSDSGNVVIMVVTDCFTKWLDKYLLPDHKAKTVAESLVKRFMCNFGVPEGIHIDRGGDFESLLLHEIFLVLGVKNKKDTPSSAISCQRSLVIRQITPIDRPLVIQPITN